jgi:N-acetylglucosamine-6-phosphate deacetylase
MKKEVDALKQLALTKVALLTPFNLIEEATLLIDDRIIVAVGHSTSIDIPPGFREIPLEGLLIAPGFIDQHVHGSSGVEVMSADPGNMAEIAKFYATHGTTSFLATTVTAPPEMLNEVAEAYANLNVANYKGARCLGLHLEGPYLSPEFPGIHSANYLRLPSLDEILDIHRISNFGVKLITMAPELDGALEIAPTLTKAGIVCSIGHSGSDYETGIRAIDAGFSCVTHCFNQLRPFHHRDPGILGVALTRPELSVELIVDGNHLHNVTVDMVWKLKGPENIILVTDAMSPTGMPDGTYKSINGDLTLSKNLIQNQDGKLAGSVLTLDVAVKNMLKITECSLTDVFRMVTYNPARLLGLNKYKGSLYPGKDADLVVLTTELDVIMTMVGGEIISGLISID